MPVPSSNNLSVLSSLLTVIGIFVACVFFIAPLKTLPDDVKAMQSDVRSMQQTQAVQAEVLKKLSDVANETSSLRRDFDKSRADASAHQTINESRVTSLQIRVGRLERGAIQDDQARAN